MSSHSHILKERYEIQRYFSKKAGQQTLLAKDKNNSKGNQVEVKPQINIWAVTKKFELGSKGLLSEIELDWLAHELSEWLDLAIVRE